MSGKTESAVIATMRNEAKKHQLSIMKAWARLDEAGRAYVMNPNEDTRRAYKIAAVEYGREVLQKHAYDVALE
jgi:hypothetical protein